MTCGREKSPNPIPTDEAGQNIMQEIVKVFPIAEGLYTTVFQRDTVIFINYSIKTQFFKVLFPYSDILIQFSQFFILFPPAFEISRQHTLPHIP